MDELTTEELLIRLTAAEDALEIAQRIAMAGRYAGAVMHEVNNPLEALSNIVFLTKNLPDASEQVIDYMTMAEKQIVTLGHITRKTLSFFREQVELRDFDLVDIVESALTLHSQRTRRQNIQIRRQLHGPAMCPVVASEILQIVSNLILNALDAVPEHDAVLCLRVKVRAGEAVVTVSDNGTGIEPVILRTLFEAQKTTKKDGTGFGLWHSKALAEKHRGRIRCRSSVRPGRTGTTFRLHLPLSSFHAAHRDE